MFLGNSINAIIEEVWVNGQQQDVWCRSQRPITDLSFYMDKAPTDTPWNFPSCYYFYTSKLVPRFTSECGPYGKPKDPAGCLCM